MRSSIFKVAALVGLIVVLSCPAFARADIISNLAGHWKFDESAGTVAVDATGNSDGTNFGATVDQPGKINSGYLFDGLDDGVNTNTSTVIPATGDFSFFAWIKTAQDTQGHIFSVNPGSSNPGSVGRANLLVYDGGGLYWYHDSTIGVGFQASGITVNDDAWHLVGVTRSSNKFELWVDDNAGVDIGTAAGAITQTVDLIIGAGASSNYYFSGLIDDARVYDRALNAGDVSELFAAVPEPSTLALLATGLFGLLCYAWRKRR